MFTLAVSEAHGRRRKHSRLAHGGLEIPTSPKLCHQRAEMVNKAKEQNGIPCPPYVSLECSLSALYASRTANVNVCVAIIFNLGICKAGHMQVITSKESFLLAPTA